MNTSEMQAVKHEIQAASNILFNMMSPDLSREFTVDNQLVTLEVIIEKCCEVFQVPIEQIDKAFRGSPVKECRQTAMWLACRFTQLSLKAIGQRFGNRDHSTVIHSRDRIEDLLFTNDRYSVTIRYLESEMTRKLYNKPN